MITWQEAAICWGKGPRKSRPEADPTLLGGAFNLKLARSLFIGSMIPMGVKPDRDVGFRAFLKGRASR